MHLVSCVCALTVPASRERALFYDFLRLRDSWPHQDIDLKGRSLDEKQTADVLKLLDSYDVVAEIVGIDMAMHTEMDLLSFKSRQADCITQHLGPEHNADLVQGLRNLQNTWREMSNQLFVQSILQSILTIMLIEEVVQTSTCYFASRLPEELGAFRWRIDAKDKKITEAERIWNLLMLPIIVTASLSHPFLQVEGLDYSHFTRFQVTESTAAPDMRRHVQWLHPLSNADDTFGGVDIGLIMKEDLTFRNSKDELGLQLADIVASAFTRAFNRTLREEGWRDLGRLLICKTAGAVRLVQLRAGPHQSDACPEALALVARELNRRSKSMWPVKSDSCRSPVKLG